MLIYLIFRYIPLRILSFLFSSKKYQKELDDELKEIAFWFFDI